MLTVIIGMLIALVLAAVVLALVAVPARREGRDVLTSEGEQLVNQALERTAGAVGAAKERVGGLAERLPGGRGDNQKVSDAVEPGTSQPDATEPDSIESHSIDLRDVPVPTPATEPQRASHRR